MKKFIKSQSKQFPLSTTKQNIILADDILKEHEYKFINALDFENWQEFKNILGGTLYIKDNKIYKFYEWLDKKTISVYQVGFLLIKWIKGNATIINENDKNYGNDYPILEIDEASLEYQLDINNEMKWYKKDELKIIIS